MAKKKKRQRREQRRAASVALPSAGELLIMLGNAFEAARAYPSEAARFDIVKQAFLKQFAEKFGNAPIGARFGSVSDALTRLFNGENPHV